jgi:hypothetical protein
MYSNVYPTRKTVCAQGECIVCGEEVTVYYHHEDDEDGYDDMGRFIHKECRK